MNHNDRKIALAALGVALLALVGIWLTASSDGPQKEDAFAAPHKAKSHRKAIVRYADVPSRPQPETFPFDPNTADSTQLLRLGLEPWQVRNIYKYRARGGIYRKKEDFARLYGLTVKDYRRLEPYIRISSDYLPASTLVQEEHHERDTLRYPVKIAEGEQVVLNTADTTELRKVPGIGAYYARRIVRYDSAWAVTSA